MSRALYAFGTGHAMVTKLYNTCFALRDGADYFLLDAGGGNGILQAMEAMAVPHAAVRHLFLSHAHTDHVLGGIWVVRAVGHAICAGRYSGDFCVWSHSALIQDFRQMCKAVLSTKVAALLDCRIRLLAVEDGARRSTAFGQVDFFDTGCTEICQFGCAIRKKGAPRVVYLGDEPTRAAAAPYVKNCDWLITEALCLYAERDIYHPYEALHSTVKDACEKAQALSVRNLILSHTEDTHGAQRKALYTQEGLQYYGGNLLIPDDREIIQIP